MAHFVRAFPSAGRLHARPGQIAVVLVAAQFSILRYRVYDSVPSREYLFEVCPPTTHFVRAFPGAWCLHARPSLVAVVLVPAQLASRFDDVDDPSADGENLLEPVPSAAHGFSLFPLIQPVPRPFMLTPFKPAVCADQIDGV